MEYSLSSVSEKTLEDLEFKEVLSQVATYALTQKGAEKILATRPFKNKEQLIHRLNCVNEYLASFENDNHIPNHNFQGIDAELKLLKIENTFLETEAFRRLAVISETTNLLLRFLRKFKEYYPTLYQSSIVIEPNKQISEAINSVINRFDQIKDNASETLRQIRKQIAAVRQKIGSSFNAALSRYQQADLLDEIRESVIDNRRVLAVKAMYRRKVKGAILGNSKTGSIVFIEPSESLQFSHELTNLLYEEKKEVNKILRTLTDTIRPFLEYLTSAQNFLSQIDIIAAKATYAKSLDAVLPQISDQLEYEVKNAYHPLLYITNKKEKKHTHPQSISLNSAQRIIVISGPNAGGKSITLKTIGLLQLMLQSGLLLPVHHRSRLCLFNNILTDIGDNQSIENQLSTYSYRLKNMKHFLKKVDQQTLFLIDEFGTGSDPELGGALAATFLEYFYEKKAYGLITTHYTNLKLLANELPYMTNANMQFDSRTLQPVFNLVTGEAGSSFTFEVAQKNGIPYSLINKAKKKIERGKVRFDATIAKLQKQRSQMEKTSKLLKEEEAKAQQEQTQLNHLNKKLKDKLINYNQLYDHNQRMIILGNRINDIAEHYFIDNKKRTLISALLAVVESENSKRKATTKQQAKQRKEKQQKVVKEITEKVKLIKKVKPKASKETISNKLVTVFKIGDRVKLTDGKAVGTIDKIEKEKAIVNYGTFITNVSLNQLTLVETKKL